MPSKTAASALIEVNSLAKRFGAVCALGGISFTVRSGEILGLVGPDGAGKTTTMRMLAGVMRPDAGGIVIDGINVLEQSELAKRHVSYMPQRFGLYEDLTVDENIRFYADLFEVDSGVWQERANTLLGAADMVLFRKRLAGQLSGGMKQKLGLICALVHTPRVLLLDEPTTGVDPLSRREFWQILYTLRSEGVAMVLATAYLDEAERCDRLALLNAGQIMFCDTPVALKARLPGAMLEILGDNPRRLRDAVSAMPGVLGVLLVGTGVHVHVDGAQRAQQIQQLLSEQHIPTQSFQSVSPSVEDLFIVLLQHDLGNGSAL